jgi:hypothetical protein
VTFLRFCPAQAVDGTAFGDGSQPGARVAGNAVPLPAFEGIDQCVLQRVLGQIKVSELADEGGEDTAVFFAEGAFDNRCGQSFVIVR